MEDNERQVRADLDFTEGFDPLATSDQDRTLLVELTDSMSKRYEDAIRRILSERVPGHVRIDGTHLPGERAASQGRST